MEVASALLKIFEGFLAEELWADDIFSFFPHAPLQ